MNFINISQTDAIATLTISRGKVNALNLELVRELQAALDELEHTPDVRAIILTGAGKFFSFGFDVPELLKLDRDAFRMFLTAMTELKMRLFTCPKPVIAAVNGHATGGGCMLVIPCDYRIMVTGNAKISLNEINLGVPVFAGSTAILTACIGHQQAEKFLYDGRMLAAEEVYPLGLINQLSTPETLIADAHAVAREFAAKDPIAFAGMKKLLRQPFIEQAAATEAVSIEDFMDAWFGSVAQGILQGLKIH
jgi:enoyl-CoA hydratase/carnithine racemase